ncbi:outer membrane beta-barrel family protein [Sinomicrobium weinanense]|uniref:TonB-dependent receptor n=1 Tax=Sinomicrobium weinanense TaxID=2842200 RepID=A0A926JTJ9_9FLAO|nr:outer membrane beta-barrel family protein [Sinomicrobium weinanense]MBC9797267.1 TonB-dependent receptor [Sinomicrobium weinanense]MBU3122331.1 TonB-dependent receptor [Sinomicrobium weinanense]
MGYSNKWAFFVFGIMFFPSVLFAQDHSLKGKIVDAVQAPLSFVNVLLLKEEDSTVVQGTSSDGNGIFNIHYIEDGRYIIKATYIGYRSYVKRVEVKEDLDIGVLSLIENREKLSEVTVTGNMPVIEKKANRLVFNVENSVLSQQNSLEILKNTPGVLMVNDQIKIRNTPATVYINGKRVFLTGDELKSLLENYPGTNIRSVEVMATPPAQYDAEDGAVLNIVTSKNISIGYKGSVNSRWTEAIFPKYSFGTNHYYKNDFLDLFASYSYSPRKEYKHDKSYFNFFENNTPDDRLEVDFRKVTRSYAHNLHSILDFTIDKKNSLSLSANILHSPGKTFNNKVISDVFDADRDLESYFLTNSELENDRSNLAFSLDYKHTINDKGAVMKAISNYIYYDDWQSQYLSTDYYNNNDNLTDNNTFDFLADQRNNIFTQQLDFSIPLESFYVETGLKYSVINSKSKASFEGADIPEDADDDNFDYKEDIYAAYGSMTKEWEKWALVLGLRGEYTDVMANSIVLGDVNTQKYFELFPTINLQHTLADDHQLEFSYKRSLNRPRYSKLNPYRYYIYEKEFSSGNPTLTRSIDNKIALDYTYKKKYTFSLYYQHTNGLIEKLTFQDNENRSVYASYFNIDEEFQYSLDFMYYGYIRDWWYLFVYMSGFYIENTFQALESDNVMHTDNTLGYLGRAYNQFVLSEDRTFTADLILYYSSNFLYGSIRTDPRFYTDIGFTKSFWDKRLVATLNFTDIFNTKNIWQKSNYLNQDNGYTDMPERRTVTIGLRYNFGNYRLKDNERNTTPDEQERLEEKE